jgi:dethiobiotin synthetase
LTVLIVTGTGTGVGKTVATAALASHARQAGLDVRLSGVTELSGLARYPQPLAPAAAAELAGAALPTGEELARLVRGLDRPGRLTLVEGAGGLLVELADGGVTLRDLAVELGAAALVVVGAELGTLNHTALTLEALDAQGVSCAGLVIGSWPDQPGAVETSNRAALGEMAPIRAVLPAGAGSMTDFAALSAAAFDRGWVTSLVH